MSENADLFKGGGTPITTIKQPQQIQQHPQQQQMQPQQQMNPQNYPPMPQMQSRQPQNYPQINQQPYEQMQQQMYRQGYQQEPQEQIITKNKGIVQNVMNDDIFKEAILVAVLFVVLNNQFVYGIQNKFIPYPLQFGQPPFINILANGVLAAILFFLMVKFLIKKNK